MESHIVTHAPAIRSYRGSRARLISSLGPPPKLSPAEPHYPGAPLATPPSVNQILFGDDLISDKNLDDVILNYLAEEFLTDEGDKK